MDLIVANVSGMKFDIEVALEQQFGALPLPFTGMDSELHPSALSSLLIYVCLYLFQSPLVLFVNSTPRAAANEVLPVPSDMSAATAALCANIGSEASAKRATSASSCTSST
jgi:hypothetical protein